MVKIGDTVKMTDKLKAELIKNDCEEHVIEFGDCQGIVESYIYPDTDIDDVDVRWAPSGLKYGYSINELEKFNG